MQLPADFLRNIRNTFGKKGEQWLAGWPDALKITQRRIAILSERLDFPGERLRDWGFCHAMLPAWWDLREDGSGGEYSLACAGMLTRA